MVRKSLDKFYLALIYIFLYAPIVVLIIFSFNESRLRGSFTGFSLKWYEQLFADRAILQALYNTVLVAVISTIISTFIGVFAAIGMYSMRGWKRKRC